MIDRMNPSPLTRNVDGFERPILLHAQGLGFAYPGVTLFEDLSFALPAGLSFVRGGEGRGKTTLLRLMAGELQPTSGRLLGTSGASAAAGPQGQDVFRAEPPEDRDDPVTPQQWWQRLSQRFAGWDGELLDELSAGFDLDVHRDKAMFMLSTGTRRKVWLAAAFASGARLTLLEKPFAALDGRSRALLAELLSEAATHPRRAWVLADYEWPAGLAPAAPAQVIDLGD